MSSNVQEKINFETTSKFQAGIFQKYRAWDFTLEKVSLLDFATQYDSRNTNNITKYTKHGSRGGKFYVINVFPQYKPNKKDEDEYEDYSSAKLILHHPFQNEKDLLLNYPNWSIAYQRSCIEAKCTHNKDTLPLEHDTDSDDSNTESDNETIPDDRSQDDYKAEWMLEAAQKPNQAVESNIINLGLQDMDIEYDWIANSSAVQQCITDAKDWLSERVKESPNDAIQILPDVSYSTLANEQQQVFLQVMAYFKKREIRILYHLCRLM